MLCAPQFAISSRNLSMPGPAFSSYSAPPSRAPPRPPVSSGPPSGPGARPGLHGPIELGLARWNRLRRQGSSRISGSGPRLARCGIVASSGRTHAKNAAARTANRTVAQPLFVGASLMPRERTMPSAFDHVLAPATALLTDDRPTPRLGRAGIARGRGPSPDHATPASAELGEGRARDRRSPSWIFGAVTPDGLRLRRRLSAPADGR